MQISKYFLNRQNFSQNKFRIKSKFSILIKTMVENQAYSKYESQKSFPKRKASKTGAMLKTNSNFIWQCG